MSTYTIKKGAHSSGFHFWPMFNTKTMRARVRFNENCVYDPSMVIPGVNKLFGVSIGFNHMENSVRYGWDSDGTDIFIHQFVHEDGKIFSQKLGKAKIGVWMHMQLEIEEPSFFGYRLYPYFGGQSVAPKNMTIDIEWL